WQHLQPDGRPAVDAPAGLEAARELGQVLPRTEARRSLRHGRERRSLSRPAGSEVPLGALARPGGAGLQSGPAAGDRQNLDRGLRSRAAVLRWLDAVAHL